MVWNYKLIETHRGDLMTLPQMRRRVLAEKEKRDLWNQIEYAKEEGAKEARAEEMGRIAREMLRDGDSLEKICRITGLTEEEVKALAED